MNREEATARCWAEIDLNELCGNYRRAKEIVGEGVRAACVLKANAYGLGAVTVCKALLEEGADFFAVASGDEAEELLTALPGINVLVLGKVGLTQSVRLIGMNALFTLFSSEQGAELQKAAALAHRPARVHVKTDSGLYRLGFSGENAADEIEALYRTGAFSMEGYFTHLALHDRETDEEQFVRFDALLKALENRGITFPMVHMCDSIGMVRYPERRYDAVRIGAWLYGNSPAGYDKPENCHAVASLKARIAQIHTVPAGERVGYDDDHYLTRDSRIATLTAGYCDGVPRYKNVGQVLIRGVRCPIFGLSCMDQLMVDVTDLPSAAAGDEVTFLGGEISLREYASWTSLNRNEAIARLGRRVTRVYRLNDAEFYENEIQNLIK